MCKSMYNAYTQVVYVCVHVDVCVCVTVWHNYGGPSEFMKTMKRKYILAPQLGAFNITHTNTHTVRGVVDGGLLSINSFLDSWVANSQKLYMYYSCGMLIGS